MMLESIRYVDLVIPEEGWGQKKKMLIALMLMSCYGPRLGRRI